MLHFFTHYKKNLFAVGLLLAIGLFFAFSGILSQEPPTAAQISITNTVTDSLPTQTPFQPLEETQNASLDYTILTPTPPATITVEGGIYPTPLTLPTMPVISPYSLPSGINPLTGMRPAAASQLDRRPVAVKITLFPRYVRPQSGLNLADVVFEYYTEWGLSRFVGVFYSNDAEAIGPVRSGRYFDAHVARMYHAYLVFKYADKRVLDYLKASDLSDSLIVPDSAVGAIYAGPNIFDSYNNYFFDTFKFQDFLERKGMDNIRPDLRSGYFSSSAQAFRQGATRIYTRFSIYDYHYWEYNETLHRYFRFQETGDTANKKDPDYAPLVDMATNQQVTADNVVILLAPYTFDNQWDEDDEVFHVDLMGSGNAYLFRDGIVAPAHWRRTDADQPIMLTDTNGAPLPMKPGRTFYEVIGMTSTFQQNGYSWFFEFETP